MLVDVKVPVLAESIAEATLLRWQKQAGDNVQRGDNLIDIETDKVTLEVSALNNGVLAEILKENGEIVQSDEVIARIETAEKTIPPASPAPATVEAVPEAETRAAAPAVSLTAAVEPAEAPPEAAPQVTRAARPAGAESPKSGPATRNLLSEHRLEAADIPTHSDRINKADVLAHIGAKDADAGPPEPASDPAQEPAAESGSPAPAPEPAAKRGGPAPEPEPAAAATDHNSAAAAPTATAQPEAQADNLASNQPAGARPEQRAPMTRLRKRTAERLLGAQRDNAILTTFNEVNMQAIMDMRQRYQAEFEAAHGIKLGFMSFFTRAAVAALRKFPIINASVEDDHIVYHGYFDIGIAVSSKRGLVVPIVRDADTLSLAELEARIRAYGQKARDGKLTIEELTGGTFTITNGGIFGSLLSTPILNPPQSAILGMHAINQRPVADNGQVVIRPMMYLALSYDHRIIDGRDAVQFLVTIKQQLEDPARLLLQL